MIDELGKREAELIAARRNNLAALRERGIDPFTATRYAVTAHAADLANSTRRWPIKSMRRMKRTRSPAA